MHAPEESAREGSGVGVLISKRSFMKRMMWSIKRRRQVSTCDTIFSDSCFSGIETVEEA